MMLLKCLTQPAIKYRKLSSGHRTGNGQFSFQLQRRTLPKNVYIMVQLHSFHILARLCWKSFKLSFSSMWTENFQMYKMSFKESKEPEIKLPTFVGSWKKQGSSRKTSTSALLTTVKPLTVWVIRNWKILRKIGTPDHFAWFLINLYAAQEKNWFIK